MLRPRLCAHEVERRSHRGANLDIHGALNQSQSFQMPKRFELAPCIEGASKVQRSAPLCDSPNRSHSVVFLGDPLRGVALGIIDELIEIDNSPRVRARTLFG